jgi:hypothetical protein
MAQSVQGWRHKWFYIKDQKSAEYDKYGFAPFDADKSLTKLTTWDALPSDAEVKSIKPLLAYIQDLKNAAGKELTGTQLKVFFLQRCLQPLQARVSKLWTYFDSNDPSRVSPKDPEKKDLDKRVRSLTTLTTKLAVPACLAAAFDSTHTLPQVPDLQPEKILYSPSFSNYVLLKVCTCIVLGSPISGFTSSSSQGRGPSLLKSLLLTLNPPRLLRIWTVMEPKVLWRRMTPLCLLPQLNRSPRFR